MGININKLPLAKKKELVRIYAESKPGGMSMRGAEVIEKIEAMSPREIFEMYCVWNGLINMAGDLFDFVRELDAAETYPEKVK